MAYFSSLLLYTALSSVIVLLVMGAIKKLQPWNKLATAIALTFLTLEWIGLPSTWRWVMSAWSPGAVLQGWFILDMQPALWQLGSVLGIAFSTTVWLEVAQKRPWMPLSGVMMVIFLCTTWLLLLSGTLLMTLSFWAVFDLVWCAASLMSGARSQRILLATATQGIMSILLWSVTLVLLRNGNSGLWWLTAPNEAVTTLLLLTALVRTGVFGFQIAAADAPGPSGTFSTVHIAGVLGGIALLYRLLLLPDTVILPDWGVLWVILSGLWYGFHAWNETRANAYIAASMFSLMAIVATALMTDNVVLFAQSAAVWIVVLLILTRYRRRDMAALPHNWLPWVAVLVLLGLPIGPIGTSYFTLLGSGRWGLKIAMMFGLAMSMVALFREIQEPALGKVNIPLVPQRVLKLWPGLALFVCMFAFSRSAMVLLPKDTLVLALVLWIISLGLGAGLLRVTKHLEPVRVFIHPVVDLLDLEWLYQAIWDGSEVLLGVVRVGADVVEGRGSLIWSVLILLLVMMIVAGQ